MLRSYRVLPQRVKSDRLLGLAEAPFTQPELLLHRYIMHRVVVLSRTHRLASCKSLTPTMLANEPVVAVRRISSWNWVNVTRTFDLAGATLNIVAECEFAAMALNIVSAGAGIYITDPISATTIGAGLIQQGNRVKEYVTNARSTESMPVLDLRSEGRAWNSATDDGALFEATAFLGHFNDLPDRRQAGKVVYPLDEVLLLTLLAVLAGAETFTDIARFGDKKLALLRRFRPFRDGTPPHDRISDIFATLDADQF